MELPVTYAAETSVGAEYANLAKHTKVLTESFVVSIQKHPIIIASYKMYVRPILEDFSVFFWSPPTPLSALQADDFYTVLFSYVKLRPTLVFVRRPSRLNLGLLSENVRKSTSIAIFKRSLKTFLFEQITHLAH